MKELARTEDKRRKGRREKAEETEKSDMAGQLAADSSIVFWVDGSSSSLRLTLEKPIT